jgi:hypothetical protein
MNWFEGLRRFGIAVGVVGACIASLFSYQRIVDVLQERKHFHQRIIHADKETYVVPDNMTDQEIIQKVEKDNPYFEFQRPAGEPIPQIVKLPSGYKLDDPKPGEIWEEQSRSHEQVGAGGWYSVAVPVAWPILGFLIPWGTLKVIRWVLAGLGRTSA